VGLIEVLDIVPQYPNSTRQSKVHINDGLMVVLAFAIMNSSVVYVANYLRKGSSDL